MTEKLEPSTQGTGARTAVAFIGKSVAPSDGDSPSREFADAMAVADSGTAHEPFEPQARPAGSQPTPSIAWKFIAAFGPSSLPRLTDGSPVVLPSRSEFAVSSFALNGSSPGLDSTSTEGSGQEGDGGTTASNAADASAPVIGAAPATVLIPDPAAAFVSTGTLVVQPPSLVDISNPKSVELPSNNGSKKAADMPRSPVVGALMDPSAPESFSTVTVVSSERHIVSALPGPTFSLAIPQSASSKDASLPDTLTPLQVEVAAIVPVGGKIKRTAASVLAPPVRLSLGTANLPRAAAGTPLESIGTKETSVAALPDAPIAQAGLPTPSPPPVVAHQVAAAIDQANSTAVSAQQAPQEGQLAGTRPDGTVRVLVVKLQPAELGTVTLRLTMRGDTLSVAMSAQDSGTMALLNSQRGVLADDLTSLGHRIGDITVNLAPAEPTRVAPQAGSDSSSSAASFSAQGGANGSHSGEGKAGGQGQGSDRPRVQVPPDEPASAELEGWRAPPRTGVYI